MKNKYILAFVFFLSSFMAAQAQYRFAGRVLGFSREYNTYPNSWCAAQILGAPNVYPQYEDIGGAWTPEDYGDQRDTIILGFYNNSPIDSVLIWETCGKGVVDSVYLKNPTTGEWVFVWGRMGKGLPSEDDTAVNILRIGFPKTAFNVSEVRIHIASDSATDWPEIDAVAIHPATLMKSSYASSAGKAASFDGVNDYYKTQFSTWHLTKSDDFTISCWLNVTADTAPKVSQARRGAKIIWDEDYESVGLTLANVNGGGDSLYALINWDRSATLAIPYTKNQWTHVAFSNADTVFSIYLNGELYSTVRGSVNDSTDQFGFMAFGGSLDNNSYFKGELDEVKFFNRGLSTSEIRHQKYSIGLPAVEKFANNLVGYWQFENFTDSGIWNTYHFLSDSMQNNGTFVTSGTLLASKRVKSENGKLYPNPNSGQFSVALNKPFTGEVQVLITDIQGREFVKQSTICTNGKINLAFSNLAAGTYILHCADETIRFVVQ
jgi:hypothetical protein